MTFGRRKLLPKILGDKKTAPFGRTHREVRWQEMLLLSSIHVAPLGPRARGRRRTVNLEGQREHCSKLADPVLTLTS